MLNVEFKFHIAVLLDIINFMLRFRRKIKLPYFHNFKTLFLHFKISEIKISYLMVFKINQK